MCLDDAIKLARFCRAEKAEQSSAVIECIVALLAEIERVQDDK